MKKLWIITAVISTIGLVSGGIYVVRLRSPAQVVSPGESVKQSITPTPTPSVELTTWTDEAGFSFKYPKDLSVNKHEEDPDNYAHVELTNNAHPGKIIVWASDAPKKWPPEGGMILDTTLGGQAAKKIITTAPVKTLSVGTVSDGLLFNVEATLTDSEYWTRVHDTIVGSFAFTDTSESAPVSGGAAPAGEAADEEEVVE